MTDKTLLVLVLAGCTATTYSSQQSPLAGEPCAHVAPGENIQATIQAALNTGCAELEPGIYEIRKGPRVASLGMNGGTLLGHGATLRMVGERTSSSWVVLQVHGVNAHISGITIDGTGRGITEEQTHGIQVLGPAENVLIEDVNFNMPRFNERSGGDCIQLLGEFDAPVTDVSIRRFHGTCDRSGVAIQRGVYDVDIRNMETEHVGDQAIDVEPTNERRFGCSPIVAGISIADSILRGAEHANAAVTFAGRGCAIVDDVHLSNVAVMGGSLDLLDSGTITLDRVWVNTYREVPALQVRKRLTSLRALDSGFFAGQGSTAEAVVKVTALNGFRPGRVLLVNTEVTQENQAPAVLLEGARSLVLDNSRIVYKGSASAVHARGGTDVLLLDSTVEGGFDCDLPPVERRTP